MIRNTVHYDAVVAGGGFSGIAAAVCAARQGLRTLLIEKEDYGGGTAVAGRHHFLCGLYPSGEKAKAAVLNGGFSEEIERLLIQQAEGRVVRMGKVQVLEFCPERLSPILHALMDHEEKLTVWNQTQIEKVVHEGDRIQEVGVNREDGFWGVTAKVFLDCSGGNLVRLSEAAWELSPASDRPLAAYAVILEGVGEPAVEAYEVAYCLAQAIDNERLAPHLKFSVWLPGKEGTGTLRISVIPQDDGYDLKAIQADVRAVHAVLKEGLAGFASSFIVQEAGHVVEREGIRMRGRAVLTENDILQARKSEGGVKNSWPVEFWDQQRGPRYAYLPDGDFYEIPDTCLISETYSNLLAAGRCLSATPRALASARVTGTCLALGERAARLAARMIEPEMAVRT